MPTRQKDKLDKLDKILQEYDKQHQPGQFMATEEFKAKFFAAAGEEKSRDAQHKTTLWVVGIVTAIAAAVLFVLLPLNTLINIPADPGSKKVKTVANCDAKIMQQLKRLFPEQAVGLCLINNELNTFNARGKSLRNIMVNYSLKRASDGKTIALAIATSSNNSSELNAEGVTGSVWVYQPDGKVLTVDTDLALQLDAQTTVKIKTSNLLKLNEKQLVSAFKYQGHEYQLFQSACRI
ncbi:MAG: hypothetical protein L3J71_10815 [Victivallaceae bacterium]|nr:hypothetical protein [Victivallaceae bacterium]